MHKLLTWTRQPKALFPLMVLGSIIVSLVLVAISLVLYNQSGAAQLDLSRPSYEAVRSQAQQSEPFVGFDPSSGTLDEEDFTSFDELYTNLYSKKEGENMQEYKNAYAPEVLSDASLGITVERE
ncbi:MAG: hypothetical protein ACTJG2_03100 [Candidatus Saccharimonadales bacterium]